MCTLVRPSTITTCMVWIIATLCLSSIKICHGRPVVRHIMSSGEFDRMLSKHGSNTGLPVIVDFYSDGCGPCRMMAPIFKKLAKQKEGKAVFAKVDTNQIHQLSSRYGVRSIPTFIFFLNGKKLKEFSGGSEQQLYQFTDWIISKSEDENVNLSIEALVEYYNVHDGNKDKDSIDNVFKKCVDLASNKDKECVGSPAYQLSRKLKKKYGKAPELKPRFTEEDRGSSKSNDNEGTKEKTKTRKSSNDPQKSNLHLASTEELRLELDARLEAEMEAALEDEDDDDAEFEHSYTPSDFPERVVIIGGGPAGISAAIYASRAGLTPVIIAPPMGGQLQGKGVDVENYPGMVNVTGPAVISAMRAQAIAFGASFEADTVTKIDALTRPFKVFTNTSDYAIETHAIIIATGAESNWLNVPGEWEMRGGGVSTCATCDGALYHGKDVIVIGGGDTAMEDALVLARTCRSVTVVHRRDEFRASRILAQRVLEHPSINVKWNTTLVEIKGAIDEKLASPDDTTSDDMIDLDADVEAQQKVVTGAVLSDISTGQQETIDADAVFIAIGHTPATSFLKDVVEFDPDRPGYIKSIDYSTRTSVPGIFASGDVSDSVYRQAITSAGTGAAAALDAERWLSEEGLGNEAAEFEMELLRELMEDEEFDRKNKIGLDDVVNVYDHVSIKGMKEKIVSSGEL